MIATNGGKKTQKHIMFWSPFIDKWLQKKKTNKRRTLSQEIYMLIENSNKFIKFYELFWRPQTTTFRSRSRSLRSVFCVLCLHDLFVVRLSFIMTAMIAFIVFELWYAHVSRQCWRCDAYAFRHCKEKSIKRSSPIILFIIASRIIIN